jgi:hypothetical protein
MPRSLKEILDQAADLAGRFESHNNMEPSDVKDAAALRAVREAFQARAGAEARLAAAVSVARAEGHSWAAVGAMVGTSGEAARQRYGQPATNPDRGNRPPRAYRRSDGPGSPETPGAPLGSGSGVDVLPAVCDPPGPPRAFQDPQHRGHRGQR